MRIFTKSLLTLALLLVANGVSAQAVWQKIFSQGWVHEWRTDEKRTESAIEPDGEGVYKVFCRSKDQAEAAGNPTLQDGNFADYDTQFFITWGEEFALKEGDKFKVTFEYMADTPIDGIGTQAHGAPGAYNHWDMIGSVNFTDEWQTFESGEKTISSNQAGNNGCWTIAFNLAKGEENTFYFRNIVVEVYGEKRATKTVVSEKTEWKELVNNNDIEGDDVSSFYTRTYPYTDGEPSPHSELAAGVGVDGSRGIRIATNDKVETNWDTQFWIKFNEEVPKGASLTVNFDYRADEDAKTTTQSHTSKPGELSYIWYSMIGDVNFTTEWEHFEKTVTVSGDQSTAEKPMGSIAFNMNENDGGVANVYYLDNISVKTGSLVNDVRHLYDGIQVLFTDWTNIPDLIIESANGKRRLYGPNDCFKVTINGEEATIGSVEYDRDGYVYIFLDEDYLETKSMEEGDVVVVSFTNPEDAKYRLVYTNGDKKDQAVEDFTMTSVYDEDLNLIPFSYSAPEIESSEPENKSFNLPATIAEFKVKFDKDVQAKLVQARLDGKDMTVEYAAEITDEIILKRKDSGNLADGEHTIIINNVFSKNDAQMVENPDHTLTFSVGAPAMHEKLQYALDKAKAALDDNEDERYAGEAYTALSEAVAKYDAEGINYTSPTQVDEAAKDLSLKTQALENHRKNCDDYDTNLATAVELVAKYGEGKFANTELYQVLKEAVGKYEGKVLTNDEELAAATADLKNNVAAGQQMFTEGVSKNGDAGIKVLVDRIRRGAEALQNSFDAAEDDELVVAANNALTDDDALANQIKDRIKLEVYKKLKDGDDSMFSSDVDEDGNEILSGPDLTVFIKNPNTYALLPKNGVNEENTPGWSQISGEGLNDMGLYGSGGAQWGNPRNIEGLPEDCAFTVYHKRARVEQTITDLPAGVYTVTWYGTDWGNQMGQEVPKEAEGFVYAKLSDTPAVEEGEEEDRDVHFAATLTSFYAEPEYSMDGLHKLEDLTITDGFLTIGVETGNDSQYFYGEVRLTLTAPAAGFDYAGAVDGIKDMKQNTSKSSVYYDLQGRRIAKPAKGIYINNNKKVVVK